MDNHILTDSHVVGGEVRVSAAHTCSRSWTQLECPERAAACRAVHTEERERDHNDLQLSNPTSVYIQLKLSQFHL